MLTTAWPLERQPRSATAESRLPIDTVREIGAGGGNRTPDIQLGKLTFYL